MTIVNLKPYLYGFIAYKNIYNTFKDQTVGVDLSVFVHRYFGWANIIDEFMEAFWYFMQRFGVLFQIHEVAGYQSAASFWWRRAKNFTKQQRQKRVNEAVDNYNQLMLKHGQEPFKTLLRSRVRNKSEEVGKKVPSPYSWNDDSTKDCIRKCGWLMIYVS